MNIDYAKLSTAKRGARPKYTKDQISTIKQLSAQGYNQTSIGAATGIPQRTISSLLRK